MGVLVDLTGHQFGWLTVKAHAGHTERRQSKWLCRCRCGSEITVLGYSLTTGAKRSCGECRDAKPTTRIAITVIGSNGERDRHF